MRYLVRLRVILELWNPKGYIQILQDVNQLCVIQINLMHAAIIGNCQRSASILCVTQRIHSNFHLILVYIN